MGRTTLLRLLNHESPLLKAVAAIDLIFTDPEISAKVLNEIAQGYYSIGGLKTAAYMVLKEWEAGRFKPRESFY